MRSQEYRASWRTRLRARLFGQILIGYLGRDPFPGSALLSNFHYFLLAGYLRTGTRAAFVPPLGIHHFVLFRHQVDGAIAQAREAKQLITDYIERRESEVQKYLTLSAE